VRFLVAIERDLEDALTERLHPFGELHVEVDALVVMCHSNLPPRAFIAAANTSAVRRQ